MKNSKISLLLTAILFFTVILASCGTHIHEFGEWTTVKEPTCTEEGLLESRCYCGEAETENIPKKEHVFDDGVITTEPTCTESGVMQYTCTLCGETKTEILPNKEHVFDDGVITIEPTCTEKGTKQYTCTLCGEIKTENLPKKEHVFDDGIITTEPTCIKSGNKKLTCLLCGATMDQNIKPLGHDFDANNVCETCGKTFLKTKNSQIVEITIPKLPKTISDYKYNGTVDSSCKVTAISCEFLASYSEDSIKIFFTGEKTYDSDGAGQSSSCRIGWKLYDDEDYVVDSGTFYSESIKTGEKFKNGYSYASDCIEPGGSYRLEILDVN